MKIVIASSMSKPKVVIHESLSATAELYAKRLSNLGKSPAIWSVIYALGKVTITDLPMASQALSTVYGDRLDKIRMKFEAVLKKGRAAVSWAEKYTKKPLPFGDDSLNDRLAFLASKGEDYYEGLLSSLRNPDTAASALRTVARCKFYESYAYIFNGVEPQVKVGKQATPSKVKVPVPGVSKKPNFPFLEFFKRSGFFAEHATDKKSIKLFMAFLPKAKMSHMVEPYKAWFIKRLAGKPELQAWFKKEYPLNKSSGS